MLTDECLVSSPVVSPQFAVCRIVNYLIPLSFSETEHRLLLFQIVDPRTRWSREMWSSAATAATASSTRSGPTEVCPLLLLSWNVMWLCLNSEVIACAFTNVCLDSTLVADRHIYNRTRPLWLLITCLRCCYIFPGYIIDVYHVLVEI